MNKKFHSDNKISVAVLAFFAIALLAVGIVLRTRIGTFLETYTEDQTKKQAETHALLMSEKFNSELETLEYIASRLEASPEKLDELMPDIYKDSGEIQGILGIDGVALYGKSLKPSIFEGIQSSFRGNRVVTYVEGEGLLFTCPVYNGPNVRYVLYRLCPEGSLEECFATDIYENLGKFCVTTREGAVVVPFYGADENDMQWYKSAPVQSMYGSMHLEMEVSVAVARTFKTDRGDMVLFESEIPGTDYLISGFVPKSVAAEGVNNMTLLVVWVFGLLMLLVMIGAFYLTRASLKVRESDALRKAKAMAEEASKAKSDFLANMSHEIRTPINAVLGMNEMILRESSDDVITSYATNVKKAGNSLLGIINDVLDFSKIEAGKIEIIPVEYSLPSMINDLVNMIQNRIEEKGLILKYDLDPELPKGLYGDEVRIKQIITNLLSNAVKYTEKGTITFGLRSVGLSEDKEHVFLGVYVEDTGIGIKPEDLKKLFSAFERIEEKKNRNIEGTGLGMSITKTLLELMDSDLNVESEYGKGSRFSFVLKQKITDPEKLDDYKVSLRAKVSDKERYRERFTAPDARVLIVDDNDMNLMVFKSLLKNTDLIIDTAMSGDECIALCKETRYDLLFLDHMMPDKDGIETLQEIREDEDNRNSKTAAVCLTANAISGARDVYIAAGFDDYLTKPIDSDELENMLLKYLPKELIKEPKELPKTDDADIYPELESLKGSEHIDVDYGLNVNKSPDVYVSMLKAFSGSIDKNICELDTFLSNDDIKNYTIKVHALKSSLLLVGAVDLSEKAKSLEMAGKEDDLTFIMDHHKELISGCNRVKEILAESLAGNEGTKKVADHELMAKTYQKIKEASKQMDIGVLESVFKEMSAYSIPEDERSRWADIADAYDTLDYDRMAELCG